MVIKDCKEDRYFIGDKEKNTWWGKEGPESNLADVWDYDSTYACKSDYKHYKEDLPEGYKIYKAIIKIREEVIYLGELDASN